MSQKLTITEALAHELQGAAFACEAYLNGWVYCLERALPNAFATECQMQSIARRAIWEGKRADPLTEPAFRSGMEQAKAALRILGEEATKSVALKLIAALGSYSAGRNQLIESAITASEAVRSAAPAERLTPLKVTTEAARRLACARYHSFTNRHANG